MTKKESVDPIIGTAQVDDADPIRSFAGLFDLGSFNALYLCDQVQSGGTKASDMPSAWKTVAALLAISIEGGDPTAEVERLEAASPQSLVEAMEDVSERKAQLLSAHLDRLGERHHWQSTRLLTMLRQRHEGMDLCRPVRMFAWMSKIDTSKTSPTAKKDRTLRTLVRHARDGRLVPDICMIQIHADVEIALGRPLKDFDVTPLTDLIRSECERERSASA
jgi:hypothetical protein